LPTLWGTFGVVWAELLLEKMHSHSEIERMLDDIVKVAPELDRIFTMHKLPDERRGACATYSRILAEVLAEYGISAEVRPAYIITANEAGLDYLHGKISEVEARRRNAAVQVWGDVEYDPLYFHAVCYLPRRKIVVDLAMTRRGTMRVPSHPYWAELGKFPWWIYRFEFREYPLQYRLYETQPRGVREAKATLRRIIGRYFKRK